jgi:2-isopropylmalate synthase
MDGARKLRMFQLLVRIGFKEIEVGFPSASQTEFDFVRRLIDENLVPDDVTIQVLTQAREPLIARTFESLKGAKRVVMHLYNATAPIMRKVVLGMDESEIVELATANARLIRDLAARQPETEWTFEYSPEMFSVPNSPFRSGSWMRSPPSGNPPRRANASSICRRRWSIPHPTSSRT